MYFQNVVILDTALFPGTAKSSPIWYMITTMFLFSFCFTHNKIKELILLPNRKCMSINNEIRRMLEGFSSWMQWYCNYKDLSFVWIYYLSLNHSLDIQYSYEYLTYFWDTVRGSGWRQEADI